MSRNSYPNSNTAINNNNMQRQSSTSSNNRSPSQSSLPSGGGSGGYQNNNGPSSGMQNRNNMPPYQTNNSMNMPSNGMNSNTSSMPPRHMSNQGPNNMYNNNNNNQYSNQRNMPSNQGMNNQGARPPFNSNAQPGMGPMRSNVGMPLNNGLLNNPNRMQSNIPPNSNTMNTSRPDWDRNNGNNPMMNTYGNQNGILPNPNSMMMNQGQTRVASGMNQMGAGMPPQNTSTGQYNYVGIPGQQNMNPMTNGLLPQPISSQYAQQGMVHSHSQVNPNFGYNQVPNQNALLPQNPMMQPIGGPKPAGQIPMQAVQQQMPMMPNQQQPYYGMQQQPPSNIVGSNSGTHLLPNQGGISLPVKMNDVEFQEILEKNRIISSTAISRAVQDASNGIYIYNIYIT